MSSNKFLYKLILLFGFGQLISCTGYFTIIGSKLIRQNTKYRVAVTSVGHFDEPHIEVAIRNSNKTWQTANNVTLIDGKIQILEFDLKDQPIDDYTLEAKTLGIEQLKYVAGLNMNTKKSSMFVQTDKAIYKPADKVQFRVLVLDGDLKPFLNEKIQIYITDGAQNRVKQFDDITLTSGVFQSEFGLSDLPVLGNWTIHVTIDDEKEVTKEFEVAKYTLPNFEVKLDVNPDANVDERKIKVTVGAKYTFGKLAKGNATVTAEVEGDRWSHRNVKVSKSVEVNGKTSVEFDIEKELGVKPNLIDKTVQLFATFKEELSGREQNATAKVQIHLTPHKIQMKKGSKMFKPELPFAVTAIVKYHDMDTPVNDTNNPVEFKIRFVGDIEYEDYQCCEQSYEVKVYPTNGFSKIDILPPPKTTKIDVEARYMKTAESIKNIERSDSKSNQYIQIKSKTNRAKWSENVTINVLSTKNIGEISYYLLSKEGVVGSDIVRFTAPAKSNDFQFIPTFAMLPKVNVIVFYITNDGEIISDSLELEFDNELRNHIDIQLPSQVKPGELVNISITSNPNSFIGLLGVDQSVLVLKKGNDIEESTVFEEIEQYRQVNRKNPHNHLSKTYTDFQSSETVLITNAEKEYRRPTAANHYRHPSVLNYKPKGGPKGRTSYRANKDGYKSRGRSRSYEYEDSSEESTSESLEDDTVQAKTIEMRKTFPETWLFDSLVFDCNQTNAILSKKSPDSLTSWIITGFSIDPVTGLVLTKQPSHLNIYQPFFVSINLPYSIKRNEVISIPISVHNYMDGDQTAEVTLFNEEGEFEFTEVKDDNNRDDRRKRAAQTQKKKKINVKSQSGVSLSFMIRPLKVGHIKIKVVAQSTLAGDGAERQLIVEPEGVTQYMNEAVFIDLRNDSEFRSNIGIVIPPDAVPDSIRIEASATGDLLGPSIENLDRLIKLPYGCGEQNMINFVPNIVVLDYLTAVNKLTPEIKAKAKTFLESGYQRELGYKHTDGSYSIWGKSDESGSTWLTAFVAKSFHQAAKYIAIDKGIVKQALDFLARHQDVNGSFQEVGYVYQKDLQGGSSNGIALTAYTLITFLENSDLIEAYKETIEKATGFLDQNYSNINDNYTLAIASYALSLTNHTSKHLLISKLDNEAIRQKGMTHWEKAVVETETNDYYRRSKPTSNVEMSAYALQSFIAAGRLNDSVQIMKWLVTQRNEYGGFQSTQDTIVGIQALARLAAKIYAATSTIDITIKPTNINGEAKTLHVNERNALILQKYELLSTAKDFDIAADGHGFGIFQLSYQYNIDTSPKGPRFNLNVVVKEHSNKEFLHLKVCTSFIPDAFTETSNMVITEVAFPSGFTFDTDSFSQLKATMEVKKVETKDRETSVLVYFDELSSKSVCPEFIALRTHSVAEQKPAPIVVYDYYDTSRHAMTFYEPPGISLCDICDGDEECMEDCKDD